jgi:hypothetical protein
MRKLMMLVAMGAAMAAAATPVMADTVSDWWEFANREAGPMGARGSPEAERAVTRAAIATFEALNMIDRRYESYLGLPPGDPNASQDAAAVTATYKVLVQNFPAKKAELDESYAIAMDSIADGPAKDHGRAIGEQAAAAVMARPVIDPSVTVNPYRPRTTPGQWVPTGLPQIDGTWATYRPWTPANAADGLLPPPPPALDSPRWAKDYEEIRRFGGRASTERTAHQSLMARYRQTPDLTPTLRLIADQPGRRPVQNARMFALFQMVTEDAATAMAVAKVHYDFWRPITAIRNGDTDGNDATRPDVGWSPLLGTPGFAEYPCGHCTYAAAIAEVMKTETGDAPAFGVRVSSQSLPNSVVQVLPSWDVWVQEVSDSRMYGGVHYRFSNEAGESVGRRAAHNLLDVVMRPLPAPAPARRR